MDIVGCSSVVCTVCSEVFCFACQNTIYMTRTIINPHISLLPYHTYNHTHKQIFYMKLYAVTFCQFFTLCSVSIQSKVFAFLLVTSQTMTIGVDVSLCQVPTVNVIRSPGFLCPSTNYTSSDSWISFLDDSSSSLTIMLSPSFSCHILLLLSSPMLFI